MKGFRKPKGTSDELTRISGISGELQTALYKLNLIKYEQIAGLTDDEIAMLDEALKLNGQIERDDWISAAQRLMAEATVDEVPEIAAEGAEGQS